jgi:hypothetical protein
MVLAAWAATMLFAAVLLGISASAAGPADPSYRSPTDHGLVCR